MIENITEKANQKIGYALYERNEKMKKQKLKKFIFIFTITSFFFGSMITVDALTNHTISNHIKTTIKYICNGKEYQYDTDCKKQEDGSYICKTKREN